MFSSINWQSKVPTLLVTYIQSFVDDIQTWDDAHPYEEGLEFFGERLEEMYKELDALDLDLEVAKQYGAYSWSECAAMALELA